MAIFAVAADFPDAPKAVTVLHTSSTIIRMGVEPPEDDGGEEIIGYRIDYDQGKVLEFDIGMFSAVAQCGCL